MSTLFWMSIFGQCSVLVTARDIAVMAATLANRGLNPLTGEQVVSPYAVARTLSVMTSSGMYDYAGEWIYRVGMPAKSGVGGGIVAALPAQLGLGTYSPLLDSHGNSVRGLRVCAALSSHFDLHLFNRGGDVRNGIVADYDIGGVSSRRNRQPHEQQILDEHHTDCHVYELTGALTFGSIEYLSRRLVQGQPSSQLVVLDFHRVPTITRAAGRLLAASLAELCAINTTVILCGLRPQSAVDATMRPLIEPLSKLRKFPVLDEAIEWAEDQIIYRYGGYGRLHDPTTLPEQQLLGGLAAGEIETLEALMTLRTVPGRPAHHRSRRARIVVVLSAKRHGERQVTKRCASSDACRRHGVRRNGAARRPQFRGRVGGHARFIVSNCRWPPMPDFVKNTRRSASASSAIWPSCWPSGLSSPTRRSTY